MPSPNNPSPTAFAVGDLVRVIVHHGLEDRNEPPSGLPEGSVVRIMAVKRNIYDDGYRVEIENDHGYRLWSSKRFQFVRIATRLEKIIYNIP